MKELSTLVIHPDDPTTIFLKKIYEGKDWTVINDRNDCKDRRIITNLIKKSDRVIMLGHGYSNGLLYTCINPEMAYLLKKKISVCIWCNSDQFVLRYGLKGFYTGMFVSERNEGMYYGIDATQEQINYSNNLFATELNKCIDDENIYQLIKESYNGDDPVIQFNNERLYYTDDLSEDEQQP